MTLTFTGFLGIPGVEGVRETFENVVSREHFHANSPYYQGVWFDGAALDLGNTGGTETIRAGMALGRYREGNAKEYLVSPWDPTDVAGLQELFGILLWTTDTQRINTDHDKWFAYVLTGGLVREDALLISNASNTSVGLSNDASGYANLLKQTMTNAGRFQLDQGLHNSIGNGFQTMETRSADYVLTAKDSGKFITTSGGAAAIILPAVASAMGQRYWIRGSGAGNVVTGDGGTGDIIGGDQTIGANGLVEFIGVANSAPAWLPLVHA